MKEVKMGRYAGPYEKIPFSNYMQSPVGLVPKAGNKIRLIFHLSYEFADGKGSLNGNTPREICTVVYNDLDTAVKQAILVSKEAELVNLGGQKIIFFGKTDLSSAFRMLPLKISNFCWMISKAEDPRDGKYKFFINKCLPFGASISCSHYQRFSNALLHIIRLRTGQDTITNYLDDFLFIAYLKYICNGMIEVFINLCKELNIPLAEDKTVWASPWVIFLGILLDGVNMILSIPLEKREKVLKLLNVFCDKKKATIKEIQVLTGYLNFLTKAIFAGCTFTRRMYAKASTYQTIQGKNKNIKECKNYTCWLVG